MIKNTCLVFDIGKTNKKAFLINEEYEIVWQESKSFFEITDEDGFACDDILVISNWVLETFKLARQLHEFSIKAINFSAYGASFVHIGDDDTQIAPLYNYLNPFPDKLAADFYNKYGGQKIFSLETGSPCLGNLNSGLQLYRIKQEKPELFSKIKYSLHLPQYLSFLFTTQFVSDITSIGCHTALWNFNTNKYHDWVSNEEILPKLAPTHAAESPFNVNNIQVGIGLHDSSAALIPYIINFQEPFVLLSTGTWCISLNPFNNTPLTVEELQLDCLNFFSYKEKPVKASRLLTGLEHEIQTKRLAAHFAVTEDAYKQVAYNANFIEKIREKTNHFNADKILKECLFKSRDISQFETYEEAYHQLIFDLVALQIASTELVINNSPVHKLFVDGGFSANKIFMNLLAQAFPAIEIYAATVAQASAMGAAMSIHKFWNRNKQSRKNISLVKYSA